jgi:hypothetical protein
MMDKLPLLFFFPMLQYYASEGFKTCLVTQSQDPTAEQLMGCKIGNSLTECVANLSTIKLETSKVKHFVERIFLVSIYWNALILKNVFLLNRCCLNP